MKFESDPSNNLLLKAPVGMPDCDDLPATSGVDETGATLIASFWKPSPEELTALVKGKRVILRVYGATHPPVYVGVEA